jgi:drug/metabolite transporter (DMT)-like permease
MMTLGRSTEWIGVMAAAVNTVLGGFAVGVTRFVIGATDALTLGALRFGVGALILLPFVVLQRRLWPRRRNLIGILLLGLLYFGLYPVLFNASLMYTTAVRGALALSATPLLTMVAAAILRVEPLTARKTLGVSVATLGVVAALLTGLTDAPHGAWRGDALMVAAAVCGAFYNVWSAPYIRQIGPVSYTVIGMIAGSILLTGLSWLRSGFDAIPGFSPTDWAAIAFLVTFGGAVTFYLWSYALEKTTPTRVAIAITLNPVAAGFFGVIVLNEPLSFSLAAGLLTVLTGIWIAGSDRSKRRGRSQGRR